MNKIFFKAFLLIILVSVSPHFLVYAEENISDLVLQKTVNIPSKEVERGKWFDFYVMYRNNGPVTSTNLVIEDDYSQSALVFSEFLYPEYCNDKSQKITCFIDSLEVGEEREFSYSVKIRDNAELGRNLSYLSIYSDQKDIDQRDNTSQLRLEIIESSVKEKTSQSSGITNNSPLGPKQAFIVPLLESKKITFFPQAIAISVKDEALGPEYDSKQKSTEDSGFYPNVEEIEINNTLPIKILSASEIIRRESEFSDNLQTPLNVETVSEYYSYPRVNENTKSGPETWFLLFISIVFAGYIRLKKNYE